MALNGPNFEISEFSQHIECDFGAISGIKKIFDQKNFWWSSKSNGDTTSCKKLEKNISQGCRTGTDARTYVRTHVRTRVNL